jgi:hypothetical protein
MDSRSVGLALALALLALLGFTAPATDSGQAEPGISTPDRTLPFRHRDHVRSDWGRKGDRERPRDCKGCHVYREDGITDPQGLCNACHRAGSLTLDVPETTPAFRADLESLRRDDRPFRHWFHRDLDCRACHDPVLGTPDDPGESKEMKMKRGWQTCILCHDPASDAVPEAQRAKDTAAFLSGINRAFAKTPMRPDAVFSHQDHLRDVNRGDASNCTPCHQPLLESTGTTIGMHEVDRASCGVCHIVQATPPVPMDVAFETRVHQSPLAGTFSHKAHLTPAALARDEGLRRDGCLACHTVEEGGVTYGLKEVFKERGYQSCNQCHFHQEDRWKLEDDQGRPDHARVESCQPCHAFGDGPMKTQRWKKEVTRQRPERFVVVSQDHPYITMRGGKIEEAASCRECHRAPIEGGLPSRIGEKPFSHDTHLPPNPGPDDCRACHRSAYEAKDSASLSLYETTGCGECHLGGEVRPVFSEDPPAAASVPEFSHADHMAAEGIKGCEDCHDAPQGGNPDVVTLNGALDCTQCHDHEKWTARTGGKDRRYVATCAPCHGPDGPKVGVPVMDFRVDARGLPGAQFHPPPEEKACAECHLVSEPIRAPREQAHVFARLAYEQRDSYHDVFPGTRIEGRCLDCHWAEVISGRRIGISHIDRPAAERVANDLNGFPGGPR